MPYYTFRHKKTGREKKYFMGISEAEEFAAANPQLEWLCGAPGFADPIRLGRKKPDDSFRDIIRDINKRVGGKANTF